MPPTCILRMEISNQQKVKKINIRNLRRYLKRILAYLSISDKDISVVLCDNSFIVSLNQKYFRKNVVTDVIAFPLPDQIQPDYLGEVVASVEEAAIVAKDLKMSWQEELLLYLVHGILHLIGFSDKDSSQRKKMWEKQNQIISKFKRIDLS